jgi:hypothetical protein
MRQLLAASVAPQRSRLFQLIPPSRSHILAAAGLHGESSARSMALAAVMETPSKKQTATIVFITVSVPRYFWDVAWITVLKQKIQFFVHCTGSPNALTLIALLSHAEMHYRTASQSRHNAGLPTTKTRRARLSSGFSLKGNESAYSAATRLPIAALTAGITFSAISSIERRDSAGSVQSLPQ